MLLIVEVAYDLLHLRSDGSGISSYWPSVPILVYRTIAKLRKALEKAGFSEKQFPLLHSLRLLDP